MTAAGQNSKKNLKHTLAFQRIRGRVRLGDVDDTVDIEGHLLARGAPVVVAEAVEVLAVVLRVEGVVAVGGGLLIDLVRALRVCDLHEGGVMVSD